MRIFEKHGLSSTVDLTNLFVSRAVSALPVLNPMNRMNKASMDDRRNLYVLGLPFALTK